MDGQVPPPDFLVKVPCLAERETRIQDNAGNQRELDRQRQFQAALDHCGRERQQQDNRASKCTQPLLSKKRAYGYNEDADLQHQRDSQLDAVYPAFVFTLR